MAARGPADKGPKGRYIPMSNICRRRSPSGKRLRPAFRNLRSGKGWTKAVEMSVDERPLQVYVRSR